MLKYINTLQIQLEQYIAFFMIVCWRKHKIVHFNESNSKWAYIYTVCNKYFCPYYSYFNFFLNINPYFIFRSWILNSSMVSISPNGAGAGLWILPIYHLSAKRSGNRFIVLHFSFQWIYREFTVFWVFIVILSIYCKKKRKTWNLFAIRAVIRVTNFN